MTEAPASVSDVLDAWGRYGALLDGQLEALAGLEPDMERFDGLAHRRTRLATEIDTLGLPSPESTTLGDRALIRRAMEACRARDREVIRRLATLRRSTADALRGHEERGKGRAGYLAGAHAAAAERSHRVDLRS